MAAPHTMRTTVRDDMVDNVPVSGPKGTEAISSPARAQDSESSDSTRSTFARIWPS